MQSPQHPKHSITLARELQEVLPMWEWEISGSPWFQQWPGCHSHTAGAGWAVTVFSHFFPPPQGFSKPSSHGWFYYNTPDSQVSCFLPPYFWTIFRKVMDFLFAQTTHLSISAHTDAYFLPHPKCQARQHQQQVVLLHPARESTGKLRRGCLTLTEQSKRIQQGARATLTL